MFTPNFRLFLKCLIVFLLIVSALDAYAEEEVSVNCHYEVTQYFEDGKLIKETKVRKCIETTEEGKQKFDPHNRFGDYVKVQLVDVGLIGVLIALAK
tara:strand:+ start:27295 stop:27585 length:291 start_codon:yes stop_codon:yes gene_type:complete